MNDRYVVIVDGSIWKRNGRGPMSIIISKCLRPRHAHRRARAGGTEKPVEKAGSRPACGEGRARRHGMELEHLKKERMNVTIKVIFA
ncbi:hypothetical protein PDENDC454_19473 [Paenibacillus dendritiformis C454]|uniref:Uncharacterized protein n=1 Tax=Paenibacillus dendritiformis C454 TaxID=1131935 RepID=H3SK17_9BACL|nr:hypothetical protein PDENDC454_19473 [Paenibacillus dendritiformis C454]